MSGVVLHRDDPRGPVDRSQRWSMGVFRSDLEVPYGMEVEPARWQLDYCSVRGRDIVPPYCAPLAILLRLGALIKLTQCGQPVPAGHPSGGQIRFSATLADWAQNAAVSE
jgi:hypothetical protein